jgi:GT2 family glycosyltransferase
MMINLSLKSAIVIANWNGWKDTLACLDSIACSTHKDNLVIVLDNASDNESWMQLTNWINGYSVSDDLIDNLPIRDSRIIDQKVSSIDKSPRVCALRLDDNYGFAAANNIGINIAIDIGLEFVMLLNNDTVCDPSALGILTSFLADQQQFDACIPQIRYLSTPNIVWNCGGEITRLGTVSYYFAGAAAEAVPSKGCKEVGFATGCALFMRTSAITKVGMLTERFFFGEEDLELSMRFKLNKLHTACVYSALIYHSVSASSIGQGLKAERMLFIHLANRYIHFRDYFPRVIWEVWHRLHMVYVLVRSVLLARISMAGALFLYRKVTKFVSENSEVSKSSFERVVRNGFDFV